MNQKIYEMGRWLLWIFLPAVGVFLTALVKAWGWDLPLDSILSTISAFSLFMGTILGIAKVTNDQEKK